MTESALKFGPEWLRALSQGTNLASPPPSPGLPKFKLAEFRYGREEMLAYFPKDVKMPPDLQQFSGVYKDQFQSPVTLVALTEEEQRIWARSVNSDAVLRLMGKGSSSTGVVPAPRGGRGGSIDRGRGRGRASYYQRGVSLEDGGDTPVPGFTRQRSYERGNTIVERGTVWDERERRYDKVHLGRDDDSGVPIRKENSRGALDWRSLKSRDDRDRDGEEDGGGWRISGGGASRTEKWGRSSWRNDRSDREHGDLGTEWPNSTKGPYRKTGSHHRVWEDDVNSGGDLLPEWSTEDNKDAESVGTFDAMGAFMETKEGVDRKLKAKAGNEEPPENEVSPNQQRSRKKSNSNSSAVSSSSVSEEESDSPAVSNYQETRKSSSSPDVVSSAVTNKTEEPNRVLGVREEEALALLPATVEKAPEMPLNSTSQASIEEPSSPTNKKEELNFEHLEKAAESLVDTWTAEEDEKVEAGHTSSAQGSPWFYRDPQGIVQGPFTDTEMMEWFRIGYFDMTLLVRHGLEGRFCQLGDVVKQWGRVPFLSSSTTATPPPVSQTTTPNTSVLNGLLGATTLPLNHQPEMPNDQEQQLRLLHQQLLHQQLIQQQHFLQQQQQMYIRQQLQVLGGLKPTENFQPLTSQQQQQYFMIQRLLAQQQQQQQQQQQHHHPPGVLPRVPIEAGGLSDPVRQFMASLASSQTQSLKDNQSLWNLPPRNVSRADAGPRWTTVPSQPLSVWDLESTPHDSAIASSRLLPDVLEQDKKFLEEQHKKLLNEEEMQRKQEEEERLRRQQQKEEERERERLILEEIQRREEEERRKREELIAKQREIEERKQREAEEQQRKEEELRKQQEERRRQAEREKEERRKQEELRRQEEERLKQQQQQEMLRLQEEQRRLEELRRQEEERRRLEEEEEKLKIEYQKELQKQLELKKLQQEAIKRLQEKQKAPAWGGQTSKVAENSLSLVEIQRLQEEKERQEKIEWQIHQQMLLQEQQLLQQQQAAQQAKAVSLTWAKRPSSEGGPVKSLLEIQKEEADKLAQQQQKDQHIKKQQQANNMSLATAGVWSNASNHLLRTSVAASSPWNVENSIGNSHSGGGFWEDSGPMTNGSKVLFGSVNKVQDQRHSSCLNNTVVNNNGPSGNKTRLMRARKDEETVMKLFEVHSQNVDEFTQWCNETLRSLQATIDVPTFVTFLKDVESPYEVYDYVRVYLGESKEAHTFAKQFLEKRSKYRNQARKKEENMWGPAPAITPSLSKPQQLSELDGQKAPGTKKKKKNKMQKVDNAILGFTVHASMDRINVGDIDHVDD